MTSHQANIKNILLTTYYLDLSGSSTFLQTLADFLKVNNFSVIVFGIVIDDAVRRTMLKNNIRVVSDLEEIRNVKISHIISQHNISAIFAREIFPLPPLIYISHGILSPMEDPPSIDIGINRYIAISEEIKKKLINKNGIARKDITIVRNFVDTNRFNIKTTIGKIPKKVLFISSRHTPQTLDRIKRACSLLKLKLVLLGKNNKTHLVEEYINNADIVISLGRGAIESMSCGRPVIVYDYQGGDGLISENNYKLLMKKNFSGRSFKKQYTVRELTKLLKQYNPEFSQKNRNIVLKSFNIKKEGLKIIEILDNVPSVANRPNYKLPYKEMKWLVKRIAYFAKKIA